MKVVEMTSTSTKLMVLLLATSLLTGVATTSHDSGGSNTGSGSITTDYAGYEGYGVPTYDTRDEMLTKLVAPFLLIALLLQLGLQTALESVLLKGLYDREYRKKKKQIRKHSTLMALAIAGMTIPSPIFKYINEYVAVLYGGITWLFLFMVVLIFGMILWGGLANSEPRGE